MGLGNLSVDVRLEVQIQTLNENVEPDELYRLWVSFTIQNENFEGHIAAIDFLTTWFRQNILCCRELLSFAEHI